jgi:hypothetical protein
VSLLRPVMMPAICRQRAIPAQKGRQPPFRDRQRKPHAGTAHGSMRGGAGEGTHIKNKAARSGRLEVGRLQGDRGAFELHWTAGGRPLAIRWAVGVQRGLNDVARASRCDWLPGFGSRRSKPLMPERNEPVIVTVRAFNDLSECWCRKSKQNGGQSNLRLSHGFHSLCLK